MNLKGLHEPDQRRDSWTNEDPEPDLAMVMSANMMDGTEDSTEASAGGFEG